MTKFCDELYAFRLPSKYTVGGRIERSDYTIVTGGGVRTVGTDKGSSVAAGDETGGAT
jgi:hypothetical protein